MILRSGSIKIPFEFNYEIYIVLREIKYENPNKLDADKSNI